MWSRVDEKAERTRSTLIGLVVGVGVDCVDTGEIIGGARTGCK
jgi:hypothetical protein